MPKIVDLASFWNIEAFSQTVLPERTVLMRQKWWKMQRLKKSNATFFGGILKQCDTNLKFIFSSLQTRHIFANYPNHPQKVVQLMKVFLTYFPKSSPIYQQAKLLLDLFQVHFESQANHHLRAKRDPSNLIWVKWNKFRPLDNL